MFRKAFLIFVSSSLFLAACERNLIVDVPVKDPKLVINAFLAKGDPIVVRVGRSRHILEPGINSQSYIDRYFVNNATVVLYEDGVMAETLVYQSNNQTYTSPTSRIIQDGKTYMLRVTAPGFSEAEAITLVPSQSVIGGLTWVREARTNNNGNRQDELTIQLDDPLEKNFYQVEVYGSSGTNYPIYCVNTSDKDVEVLGYADPLDPESCFNGGKILLRDDNFNGRRKLLKLFVPTYEMEPFTTPSGTVYRGYVKVNRITQDQFNFMKSYAAYETSFDNPFAEPVNVFSNVKNGYGIFSTYTMAVDTLR